MDEQAQLGDLVRDRVTGLTGIVTGMSTFLYGCTRVAVQPKIDKDGKVPEAIFIDSPQCEVLERGVVTPEVGPAASAAAQQSATADRPGGPASSVPTRNVCPTR